MQPLSMPPAVVMPAISAPGKAAQKSRVISRIVSGLFQCVYMEIRIDCFPGT